MIVAVERADHVVPIGPGQVVGEVRAGDRARRDRLPVGREVRPRLLRESHRRGPVGVHHPDVDVALTHLERGERDPRPVGRPGGIELLPSRRGRQVLLNARGDVDREQVERPALAAALEDELRAVGRPRGVGVDRRVGREANDTGPVGEHQVELGEPAVTVRDERDTAPVGRPHGRPVGGTRRLRRQLLTPRTVGPGDEDPEGLARLRSNRVDDLGAVRRPGRIAFGNRGRGQPGAPAPRRVHHEQVRAAGAAGPPHVRDPVAHRRPRRLQLGGAGAGRDRGDRRRGGIEGEHVRLAVAVGPEDQVPVARGPPGRLRARLTSAEPEDHGERDREEADCAHGTP